MADKLLIGTSTLSVLLPPAVLEQLLAAGVNCVLTLLSKDQFRAAGADILFGPLGEILEDPSVSKPRRIFTSYAFWPSRQDTLPTARQVRLTLDDIDRAHEVGATVFIHGSGVPARAIMAAGCWLARHGGETDLDPQAARLGWLRCANEACTPSSGTVTLTDEQRSFVRAWPTGNDGEPLLTAMETMDEDEVYPLATIEYWLRVLPMARVYPKGLAGAQVDVPVLDHRRISNGADVHLEIEDLLSGEWISERTLRLLDGSQVVFSSSHLRPTA